MRPVLWLRLRFISNPFPLCIDLAQCAAPCALLSATASDVFALVLNVPQPANSARVIAKFSRQILLIAFQLLCHHFPLPIFSLKVPVLTGSGLSPKTHPCSLPPLFCPHLPISNDNCQRKNSCTKRQQSHSSKTSDF